VTTLLGRGDFDVEESFQKRCVRQLRRFGVIEFAGECFGGGSQA